MKDIPKLDKPAPREFWVTAHEIEIPNSHGGRTHWAFKKWAEILGPNVIHVIEIEALRAVEADLKDALSKCCECEENEFKMNGALSAKQEQLTAARVEVERLEALEKVKVSLSNMNYVNSLEQERDRLRKALKYIEFLVPVQTEVWRMAVKALKELECK